MREQGYNISELCEALEVSRSGYYGWKEKPPGDREAENAEIAGRIREIHSQRFKRAYGSPRLTGDLREIGFACSENRVARIMKKEGIRAKFKSPFRPKTTCSDASAKFSPNILKDAVPPSRPGEQVAADITYVSTAEGWLYLSVVIDLFSRKIIGWALGDSMHASLVADSIGKASRHFAGGALFHSDRGCQYTSGEIRAQIASLGMLQSMSAKGNCYDNATCESFFASLKAEAFPDDGRFDSKQHARLTIFEYLEAFYNRTRRHSSLGNIPPEQFLEQRSQNQNQQLN
jgi:putative transposase